MKNTLSRSSLVAVFILFAAITSVAFAYPSQTHAAELTSQTAQLLPLGQGNACPQIGVSGLTPYIYNGALHSFEFNVSDASYVSIAGSVGGKDVPFYQMVRRPAPGGGLRVHVDIATTPVGSGLPIKVTMLSAKGAGQPVCISIISGVVMPEGGVVIAPSPIPTPFPATPSPAPAAPQVKPAAPAPAPAPAPTPSAKVPGTTAAPVTKNVLKDMCESGGAPRLWFVLLAVYALIVAGAVFGRPHLPVALRSQEWVAAMIVVPFLVLFGIWYFVEACRVSAWVPVIATLIALAGLAAAFWEKNTGTPVINLPAGGAKK